MLTYLWIGIGGAMGSVARYWCSGAVARLWGETFPWGTLAVNVLGSLLLGLFVTVTGPGGRWLVPLVGWQFFVFGICGGFTTFSSFSMQTLQLLQAGEWWKAAGNVVLSVVICLSAAWLGHVLGSIINHPKGA